MEQSIIACHLSSIRQSHKELQLTCFPNTTQEVKDFALGTRFTVFHLDNNDLIFMKNEEYLNSSFNMQNIDFRNIRKNVAKFNTKSNDLFYLTPSGHLHIIFFDADLPSNQLNDVTLTMSLSKQIADFDVTYPHVILLFKPSLQSTHTSIYQDIQCLEMHNLTSEDMNSPLRLKKVEGLNYQQIISFCVGIPAAYFLTTQNKVYECDFGVMNNNNNYAISLYEGFKNIRICRLWAGPNYFFAMEDNDISTINKWSQEEIIQWVISKNYNEYVNILKYENITGQDLLNADKTFLIDRLGMEIEDLQVKFLNDIHKVSKKTLSKPRLYAWGNNKYGQLGLVNGQVMINNPLEIKGLPGIKENDNIRDIECGFKAAVIVTEQGKIWITQANEKNTMAASKEEEEENKNSKSTKNKKKRQETSVNLPKRKVIENMNGWLNITPKAQEMRNEQYKVMKVSLNKDHFVALGSYINTKGEQTVFKRSEHICDRLLWDKSLNKEEYIVGYEDRFLGILEIPFTDFCTKRDIPSHRIKFFKKKEEIVWDRALKINKI